MSDAIGMVETVGLVGSSRPATPWPRPLAYSFWAGTESALAGDCVLLRGCGAVKSAVDAGSTAAAKVGEVHSVHVIPRPHSELTAVVPERSDSDDSDGRVRALGLIETKGGHWRGRSGRRHEQGRGCGGRQAAGHRRRVHHRHRQWRRRLGASCGQRWCRGGRARGRARVATRDSPPPTTISSRCTCKRREMMKALVWLRPEVWSASSKPSTPC